MTPGHARDTRTGIAVVSRPCHRRRIYTDSRHATSTRSRRHADSAQCVGGPRLIGAGKPEAENTNHLVRTISEFWYLKVFRITDIYQSCNSFKLLVPERRSWIIGQRKKPIGSYFGKRTTLIIINFIVHIFFIIPSSYIVEVIFFSLV